MKPINTSPIAEHGMFQVRAATSADRAALTQLTERARRTHFHLDWWTLDEWIGNPERDDEYAGSACLVAVTDNKIAGVLVAPAQDGPVAWVRLLALSDQYNPKALLDALLLTAEDALRASAVDTLACLAYPDWLARLLSDLGFSSYTDVTTFRKSDRRIPQSGLRDLIVRPAGVRDLPAVLENDRAAFEPLWWHSADSLERVLTKVAHFVVGELDGEVVGHAFSDLYGDQGHLVRLAVHPSYQGLGVGSRLLAESLSHMLDIGAWPLTLNTQADNFTSQSLYNRFGYMPIDETVTVMTRQL